jgi:DNA-binding winged helix-turn-helix (wHTH) protein
MDDARSAEVFLLEKFRFDRRGGGLFYVNGGASVPIGSRALEVLGVLIDRAGELVSRDEIIGTVWPGTVVEDANLFVQISTLRRVLDDGRFEASAIQTVSGRGYRFVGGVTRSNSGIRSGDDAAVQISGRVPPRLSMVVLPFTNLSEHREQEYFVDALTDLLTTDLSRIRQFRDLMQYRLHLQGQED